MQHPYQLLLNSAAESVYTCLVCSHTRIGVQKTLIFCVNCIVLSLVFEIDVCISTEITILRSSKQTSTLERTCEGVDVYKPRRFRPMLSKFIFRPEYMIGKLFVTRLTISRSTDFN